MKAPDAELRFSATDGQPRCVSVRRARGFLERLLGLVATAAPGAGQGLWIDRCAAVHTFGVRAPLDLAFVSSCMVVLRVDAEVAPRSVRLAPGARAVLELGAGEARRLGLRAGARLAWARCEPERSALNRKVEGETS